MSSGMIGEVQEEQEEQEEQVPCFLIDSRYF